MSKIKILNKFVRTFWMFLVLNQHTISRYNINTFALFIPRLHIIIVIIIVISYACYIINKYIFMYKNV